MRKASAIVLSLLSLVRECRVGGEVQDEFYVADTECQGVCRWVGDHQKRTKVHQQERPNPVAG